MATGDTGGQIRFLELIGRGFEEQVELTCAEAVALRLINSAARCAWAAAVNTARLSAASTRSQVAI